MPSFQFWITGTALYLAVSFAFAIAVGLLGIKEIIPKKVFYIFLTIAVILSFQAWRVAAQQEQDAAFQVQEAAIASKKLSVIEANISKIANVANINPDQSADIVSQKIIEEIKAQSVTTQKIRDDLQRHNTDLAKSLASFVIDGEQICQNYVNSNDVSAISMAYTTWNDQVVDYINQTFGVTYLAPFLSAQGNGLMLTNHYVTGDNIYSIFQAKLQVLNTFIANLAR